MADHHVNCAVVLVQFRMNVIYDDRISDNRVPAEYNTFATASLTLLIFEFIALRNIVMEMFLPAQIAEATSSSNKKGTQLNLKKKIGLW